MPHYILRQKLRDALGQEYCAQHGLEFTKVNPPQEMLDYLSRYLEGLLDRGYRLEHVVEPQPTAEMLSQAPEMAAELRRPMMLIVSAQKRQ